jgi:hypothetical protein
MIQERIKEAIIKHKKIEDDEIKLDSRVDVSNDFGLVRFDMEEFNLLRPDISFWVKEEKDGIVVKKLMIVEISIPIGRKGKTEDYNTLEEVRMRKQRKYSHLVNFLRGKLKEQEGKGFKYEVSLKLIIVSSLGAVSKRTLEDLKDILGRNTAKSTIELWAQRLCITAIRGSFCVEMKAKDGVDNLMKEKRNMLHDINNCELKNRIEKILFDHESQDQEVDIRLKDEINEMMNQRERTSWRIVLLLKLKTGWMN